MVQITVTDDIAVLAVLDLGEDTDMEVVRYLIEQEGKVDMTMRKLTYNGKTVKLKDTLKSLGIQDGDLLYVEPMSSQSPCKSKGKRDVRVDTKYISEKAAEEARQLLARDSKDHLFTLIKLKDPELHAAIVERNFNKVKARIYKQMMEGEQKRLEEKHMLKVAYENPISPEAQQFIADVIKKNQIQENLEMAHEHFPESFESVFMLFVKVEINKRAVRAFVDTGAQTSVMTKRCAEACNILRLMDTRYMGLAKGVGTSEIIGRIHMVDIKIGNNFYVMSLVIIDNNEVDFIFGLDMLLRYQCVIDLQRKEFVIDGQHIHFLSEKEAAEYSFQNVSPPD